MSEFCPLRTQMPVDPPEFCRQNCENLWDQAVTKRQYSGGYDWYNENSHRDVVESEYDTKCLNQDVEYDHDGLTAISEFERDYVIVDACGEGHELGEQGFRFICPLPLE